MRSPAVRASLPVRDTPGDLDRGHESAAAHLNDASVNTLPPARPESAPSLHAPGADLDGDHTTSEDQFSTVAVSEGNGHGPIEAQNCHADPSDALLLILADSLNGIEALRKATANQLHSLTRERDDKGGKGLSPHGRAAVMLTERLAVLEGFEHKTVLELQRALRAHRFGPWVKRTVGLGEKQAARLIAAIGDPAWNGAEKRPRRGPAELWKYCGYAPGQKRRKGIQSNWNAEAKTRAFLCAESCMKQRRSPYRAVYDNARANWADRETSDAHKHAHALRCVAKAILKDLWREATVDAAPVALPPAPQTNGEDA